MIAILQSVQGEELQICNFGQKKTRSHRYERTDDSGSSIIIGKIFYNIVQIALQDLAESIQRVRRDGFAGL